MAIDPIAVWADMTLKTWPERYWMLDLAEGDAAPAAEAVSTASGRYACLIRDQAGISVVIDQESAEELARQVPVRDRFGPFRVVSTDGDLPFDVIGFLKPVLERLNAEGIKAGPQCGAVFDHLFIYEKDIDRAETVLEDFIAWAKSRP
ncbi:MAG: hypothetical protein NXI16_03520 [Alphaproteobacteria bacterium]|nr:hypothetical protein [Alphaproteobacteria bacterium]